MFFLMSYLLDAIQLPVPAFDHPFPCTIMYCTWFLFFGSAAAGLLMLVLGGITSVQLIVLILALSSDQHAMATVVLGTQHVMTCAIRSGDTTWMRRFSIVGSSLCDASKNECILYIYVYFIVFCNFDCYVVSPMYLQSSRMKATFYKK